MAKTASDTKNIQVSAVISPETHEQLQELRWSQRVEKVNDLVRKAIEEFVEKHSGTAPQDAKVTSAASSK